MTPGAASPAVRDAATPTLAAVLLLLAAGVVGLAPGEGLPTSPEGYAAAAALVASAWCGVVAPSLRGARPGTVLASACVAAPFLALAEASAVAPLAWPVPALALAVGLGVLGAALAPPARRRVTAGVACALVLGPLVGSLGGLDVPESLLLPRAPLSPGDVAAPGRPARPEERVPEAWRDGTRDAGRRIGALARRPRAEGGDAGAVGSTGIDAPFVPVPEATPGALPRGGFVLRVLGPRPPLDRLGRFAILSGRAVPASPLDLDGVDVVELPAGLDLDAREADVLARYVRRGGLLVGPPPPAELSATLRRRLGGGAVPNEAGPAGAHVAGLGHVALAGDAAGLEALAVARLVAPRLSTAFDRAVSPPRGLLALSLPTDEPAGRRDALAILLPFAAALVLLGAIGGRGHAFRVSLVSLAAATIVLGLAERAPPAAGQAFRLELGGAGGRRVEGLVVSAGPAGLLLDGAASSEGGLRALGFEARILEGRLRWVLAPGGRGVIVEEGEAGTPLDGMTPTGDLPPWAQPWIDRGDASVGAFRLLVGTALYRGPRPRGVRVQGGARCLLALPGRP